MATVEPGWYDDPGNSSGERYWDGQNWTSASRLTGSDLGQSPYDEPVSARERAASLLLLIGVPVLSIGMWYAWVAAASSANEPMGGDTGYAWAMVFNFLFALAALAAAVSCTFISLFARTRAAARGWIIAGAIGNGLILSWFYGLMALAVFSGEGPGVTNVSVAGWFIALGASVGLAVWAALYGLRKPSGKELARRASRPINPVSRTLAIVGGALVALTPFFALLLTLFGSSNIFEEVPGQCVDFDQRIPGGGYQEVPCTLQATDPLVWAGIVTTPIVIVGLALLIYGLATLRKAAQPK